MCDFLKATNFLKFYGHWKLLRQINIANIKNMKVYNSHKTPYNIQRCTKQ